MSAMINHRTALVLTMIAAPSAGCAESGVKKMVTMPKACPTEATGAACPAIVMFRAAVDLDGKVMQAPFSAFHSTLFLTAVGPKDTVLTPGHGILPGRLDSTALDAGWAFLALPPGPYQLALEGLGVRFTMSGAQLIVMAGAPIGLSIPSAFVVPPGVRLIYVGTFGLTCHKADGKRGALSAECTTLAVRDESELARQIAQTSLSEFGPMQEVAASVPEAKRSAANP